MWNPERSPAPPSQRARIGRRTALVLAAALAGVGAWACDGANAFQPVTTAPRIVELDAPSPSASGDPLPVSVRAVGIAPLDSLTVTMRVGEFTAEEGVEAEIGQRDLSAGFSFEIPVETTDTVAVLRAMATDMEGNASPVVERRIRILDAAPPAVELEVTPEEPALGGEARFQVSGSDNIGLRRLGVRVLAPDSEVLFADSAAVAGRTASASFTWTIPETLAPGEGYTVEAFAVDLEGNRSAPVIEPLALVDDIPPVIAFLTPASGASVVAGDSILVTVRVTDNTGVQRVEVEGSALYGDPDLGTEEAILRFRTRFEASDFDGMPADTTVSRYLIYDSASAVDRPTQVAVETLRIQVRATDESGTPSTANRFMQLLHDLSPPQITILEFEADAIVDPASIDTVRVRVSDVQGQVRTGVRLVTLEAQQITGSAVDGSLSVQTLAGPLDFFPQEPPIVEAQTLSGVLGPVSESEAPRGAYYLIATARDTIGNVAADTVRLFSDPPSGGASGAASVGAGAAPAGVGGFQAAVQPWESEVARPRESENGRAQTHRLADRGRSEARVRKGPVSGLQLPR